MTELILYHAVCLIELFLLYIDYKGQKNKLTGSLETVYIMTGLLIITDCLWGIFSYCGYKGKDLLYLINVLYFFSAIFGVYAWMCFTLKTLDSPVYKSRVFLVMLSVPALAAAVMTFLSPFTGLVFRIEDGTYVRGRVFFLDAIIKLLYLSFSSVIAFVYSAQEPRKYLKKQYLLLGIYCIPVIVAGLLQALFGIDFNCIGPVLGLAIVYKFGLSNEAKDNGDLVNALARSYTASFLVNEDDHKIRTLAAKGEYRAIETLSKTMSYEDCLYESTRRHVVPEDRIMVERSFSVDRIRKQLEEKNTYTIIYRVRSKQGQEGYNKATFMKAFNDEDRHEFFIAIERLETRQILMQERENLENEKEEFERVKESLTNVLANIIEARDVDSGEHVMRVRNYTQILASQMMEDFPKYDLTPLKIRYIVNGSALHDVGKIMIPDAILLKPEKLSSEEYEIMKTHTVKGCEIIEKLPDDLDPDYVRIASEICRSHHEKYDGGGYPQGLKGDEIPISAQIVSLVDCFDALTTKRVYKEAISKEKAYRMILDGECGEFNCDLLDCFRKSFVELCRE